MAGTIRGMIPALAKGFCQYGPILCSSQDVLLPQVDASLGVEKAVRV
jgi:hypothetical protein